MNSRPDAELRCLEAAAVTCPPVMIMCGAGVPPGSQRSVRGSSCRPAALLPPVGLGGGTECDDSLPAQAAGREGSSSDGSASPPP